MQASQVSHGGSDRGGMNRKTGGGGKSNENMSELERKDEIINNLEYRVSILQKKITKLEQLVELKEKKIKILEKGVKGN